MFKTYPHITRPRLALVAALLFALLLPVACTVPGLGSGSANGNLDSDPCLLQQYQNRSWGVVSHMQGAASALTGRVDALQGSRPSISSNQDITDTLFALTEFQSNVQQQLNQMNTTARPPEGAPFVRDVNAAVAQFDTATSLLTEAYVATANGGTRAATDIAFVARRWMRQGRALLDAANGDLSVLKTYNVNC